MKSRNQIIPITKRISLIAGWVRNSIFTICMLLFGISVSAQAPVQLQLKDAIKYALEANQNAQSKT